LQTSVGRDSRQAPLDISASEQFDMSRLEALLGGMHQLLKGLIAGIA
jgi:hypothetical protein